jgi:hypothetical protein
MEEIMKYTILVILCALLLVPPSAALSENSISICSFNIQFLGNSTSRDDAALAEIVKEHDIVVVQELVAPPYAGTYPNGDPYTGDTAAAEFFEEMKSRGFEYLLSEEDTGTGATNHNMGSATEWWVAFYKPGRIEVATDLPQGFLDSDHTDNPNFERVPYSFGFRSKEGGLDFVLISVHLQPGSGSRNETRRFQELNAIARWVDSKDNTEKDYIILGDMNIEDCEELAENTPGGFVSMNSSCVPTNTNVNGPKPYDHVMYRPAYTQFDIDSAYRFKVTDLIEGMRSGWDVSTMGPYPGDPYNHNEFRKIYTDHCPVSFQMLTGADAD